MGRKQLRKALYEIIFEADTEGGKLFDVVLLIVIFISILVAMFESIPAYEQQFSDWFRWFEWIITGIFTVEYLLRIYVVRRAHKYIFSFFGIIDLLAILPTYLGLIFVGTQSLVVIRVFRLIRVFRIFKLSRYTSAGQVLAKALWSSRAKISVFLFFVLTLMVIVGTIMYLIEGGQNGFTSIPESIYWAIVTMTTVGYGDISPITSLGKFIASGVMIIGYAIIAVPTGIVSVEIFKASSNTQVCPECLEDKHADDALFCKKCGSQLNESQ